MHRFYVSPNEWNPEAPFLSGSEAHHCRSVLRLRPRDTLVVFNGQGCEITAEIISHTGREVRLRKLHENRSPQLRCHITLAQAIAKGRNMDLIMQKAVELGASRIVPIISDRTIVRLCEESFAEKQAKWQTVAIEAAKQSGQNWVPEIRPPCSMAEFFLEDVPVAGTSARPAKPARLDQDAFDLQLIASLESNALHLKSILAEYSASRAALPNRVFIMIGPEGDFTPAELGLAREHGCRPITLGPNILRVETAAIYCLSVLSYELLS